MKAAHAFLLGGTLFIAGIADLAYVNKIRNSHPVPIVAGAVSRPALILSTDDNLKIEKTLSPITSNKHLCSVFFPIGSTSLSYEEKSKLTAALNDFTGKSQYGFVLDGHADSIGSKQVNNDLFSAIRSYSVSEYLVQLGIDKERIYTRAFGLQQRQSNSTNKRRVDISIIEVDNP